MPQDHAEAISIKLVSYLDTIVNVCLTSLRGNTCDIEVCTYYHIFLRVEVTKYLGSPNFCE